MAPYQILTFLLAFAGFLSQSYAVIDNIEVYDGTASRIVRLAGTTTDTTTSTEYTIYGGYAGAYGDCQTPSSITSTCDSCTALTNLTTLTHFGCSNTSVHPNLELTIRFRPTDAIPSGATVIAKHSGSTSALTLSPNSSLTLVTNQDVIVKIPWNEICSKVTDIGSGCVGTGSGAEFSGTLQVGISVNGTDFVAGSSKTFTLKYIYRDAINGGNATMAGACDAANNYPFCQFTVRPGDEKVYIQDLTRGTLAPTGQSTVKWKALRVYYSENTGNFAIPMGNGSRYADFDIINQDAIDSPLSNNKITGLTNEQEYMFTIASVDDATLVRAIKDVSRLTIAEHVAKPGKVVGLLDGQKCFIATAAFGSPMAPQVEALRQFRNQYLLTNPWGIKFVETYYKYSPPLAQFIAEHEFLRIAVRGALWPLVMTANWLMNSEQGRKAHE